MAKICFVNAYETSYLGTRILASWLLANNHEPHNILLNSGEYIKIDEPLDQHEGYQSYDNGALIVNKATRDKVTEDDIELLKKILRAEKPDVIGFSARSTNNWLIPVLIPAFREACPAALLIAGGFGPTLEPELYLDGGFDCVVRGDGEEALLELMNLVPKTGVGREFPLAQAAAINNTVWKQDGAIKYNPLSAQEKQISKYGAPLHGDKYFSFINNGELRRFYDPELRGGMYHTFIGRGCIGHCTYCSGGQWSALYKKAGVQYFKRRNREIPELIGELRTIPQSASHIWFVDEFFALSREKTLELCRQLKQHIRKTFFCYINYDYMLEHEDIFYALVDAGLIGTGVGFQTGSEKFAREHYHRHLSNDHLLEFTKLCFNTNLLTGIHLIGGNCYEDEETFRATASLIRKLPFSIEYPELLPLENIRLRPHPQSPITYLRPNVVSAPMPAKEWFYRGVMWSLARIFSEEEWEEIYQNQAYKDDPVKLNEFYIQSLKDKQRLHFEALNESLQDKRVVFYGMGQLYEHNKDLFPSIKPEAIICDAPYAIPVRKDNIPCFETEDFLGNTKGEDIYYITFINWVSRPRIKLNFRHGVPNERIHSVTSML